MSKPKIPFYYFIQNEENKEFIYEGYVSNDVFCIINKVEKRNIFTGETDYYFTGYLCNPRDYLNVLFCTKQKEYLIEVLDDLLETIATHLKNNTNKNEYQGINSNDIEPIKIENRPLSSNLLLEA